jgi:MFS family permease
MTEQQLERPSTRAIDVALVVTVYAVAAVVLIVPTLELAIGVQALGDAAGWWQGDPNSNDGEENWATSFGVGAYLVVLSVTALIVRAMTARFGIRTLPCVVTGTAAIVLGAAAVCTWWVASGA